MENHRLKIKKRIAALRVAAITFFLVFLLFMLIDIIIFRHDKTVIMEDFKNTSMRIRDSVIGQIHYESFTAINDEADMDSDIYISLWEKLDSVRTATDARYLYTAQLSEGGSYVYVVDGLPKEAEDFAGPGTLIEPEFLEYMKKSLAGETVFSDDFMDTEWGTVCAAYFPIYEEDFGVYGVLGMEFDMERAQNELYGGIKLFIVLAVVISLIISFAVTVFYRRMRKNHELVQTANDEVNRRLKIILDGISGGFKISLDDSKYTYAYVSEEAAAIQGYTVEEFMEVTKGSAVDNVYPPDLERVLAELARQYGEGDSYSCKYRVVHKDGSLKWIVDNGKRFLNDDGELYNYSMYQDVTDIEEKNIQLNEVLMMMHHMFSSLSDGVIAYELPGHKLLMVNDEAKRIFGIKGEVTSELLKDYIQRLVMPDNRNVVYGAINRLKRHGDGAVYTFRMCREDGSNVVVQTYTKLLHLGDGTQFILSCMLDVTERSMLNDVLRQERRQYREALTNNSEYFYSLDVTEGLIHQEFVTASGLNPVRYFGMELPAGFDELNQKSVEEWQLEFVSEGMKKMLNHQALVRQFEKGNTKVEVDYYNHIKDKYIRVTALMMRRMEDGHILGIVVASDITKIRREEEQKKRELLAAKNALEEAYEAANRASSAKTGFLFRMSHDIRTPMNAIIGMTAIAGAHLDDPERVSDCLGKITVSSKYLLGLINDVLDMSKIESGKLDLNDDEFNLSELVDDLITMSRSQMAAKRHELTVSNHGIEHELVVGDNQHIQQCFVNLMSNAIKYTPEGGHIHFSIAEKRTNNPKAGCYEFVFEDDGIGMTEEFQKHIFEPFSRAEDEVVQKTQGTGLGMSITRNIVRMMDGTIDIDSKPGRGTKVTVTIYLKLQNVDEQQSYEELAKLDVLVADADSDACQTTCRILDGFGMSSEGVLSGAEAVERTVGRHNGGRDYFAVILAWKMPGMDGVEATRRIRDAIGSGVPIIIISSYDWTDIEAEARAAGASAFISKPIFRSRLASILLEFVNKGGQTEQESEQPTTLNGLSEENFKDKRVLLVEDNELNAEIAGEIFGAALIRVDYARDGKEAVDIMSAAEDGYYDIIFMDIQMPIMNGYDAARAIRALPGDYPRTVPIVAMTANAFADDVKAALDAGMNEHIMKPIDLKRIVGVLRKWLR